jgi:hypothetical protein
MSSQVVGSLKSTSCKVNIDKSCNKRIFNIETGESETCGKKPVIMIYSKQFHCREHRDLRRNEINAKNQVAKLITTKKESISNAHPSMSVIWALSEDGFYLDISPDHINHPTTIESMNRAIQFIFLIRKEYMFHKHMIFYFINGSITVEVRFLTIHLMLIVNSDCFHT